MQVFTSEESVQWAAAYMANTAAMSRMPVTQAIAEEAQRRWTKMEDCVVDDPSVLVVRVRWRFLLAPALCGTLRLGFLCAFVPYQGLRHRPPSSPRPDLLVKRARFAACCVHRVIRVDARAGRRRQRRSKLQSWRRVRNV